MKDSRILESFFQEQHRRWRRRAYTFFHPACGKSPHPSDHVEWLKGKNAEMVVHHRSDKEAGR